MKNITELLKSAFAVYNEHGGEELLRRAGSYGLHESRVWARDKISPSDGRGAIRDPFADIEALVGKNTPVIIDGGANEGEIISRFSNLFERPIIHAFEPDPRLARKLNKDFGRRSRITIHNTALGSDSKKVAFNVCKDGSYSSVLQPGNTVTSHADDARVEQKTDVEMCRLDDLFQGSHVDVLKLNTQGYELEALKGARETLQTTRIVFLRHINFIPLYDDEALFADLDSFLSENGFRLFNLYNTFTYPSGQVMWTHALYLNNSEFNLNISQNER